MIIVLTPRVTYLKITPGYFMDEIIDGKPVRTFAKYQAVKKKFDLLQYWPAAVGENTLRGRFNPYAVLIHGADYINAPFVYAYSVDDAVGNMQVAGDGLILAVEGRMDCRTQTPLRHLLT